LKFQELVERPKSLQRIKVAILDSGIDKNDVVIKRFLPADEEGILKFRDTHCVAYPNTLLPLEDKYGHGTRCAALLLRTAPDIELFVARIFDDKGKMKIPNEDQTTDDDQHIVDVRPFSQ
jgi:hypothetical protein